LLKAVGVNVEDGYNVVVMLRLVGLLARESRCWRRWAPTWRVDKAWWLCRDCPRPRSQFRT